MGDKYVTKQELDIWGNEQTVVRRAVSGADVVNGLAGGISFLAARHQDAKLKSAMDKMAQAEKYADAGDFDTALLVVQQVTAMGGKEYQFIGNASTAMILTENKKDYEAAIPLWNRTLELASQLGETQYENAGYKWRGICYYRTKQIADALRDFAKYSQLEPQDAEGPAWLGMSLIELGDLPQAVAKLTQAISLAPGEAWIYRERAYAYTHMGDKQAAVADMNKAIVLAPKVTRYYYRRGELQADLGNTDAAIADYTHALELDPSDVEVLEARAKLYKQTGNPTRHVADVARISNEQPIKQAYDRYLKQSELLYKNGNRTAYTPYDEHTEPEWARIIPRVLALLGLAAVTWWGTANWQWQPGESNQLFFYLIAVALFASAIYVLKIWIDVANKQSMAATQYREKLEQLDHELPGFSRFYPYYLDAKTNSQLDSLPTKTRFLFVDSPGPQVQKLMPPI